MSDQFSNNIISFRKWTHPLFLQDYFLSTGHDLDTHCGTATFIKYCGRHYLCTCDHVREKIGDPNVVNYSRFPTSALMFGSSVLNLSNLGQAGLSQALYAVSDPQNDVDVAIADMELHWEFLQEKGKSAIDLDSWREPNWKSIRQCAVAGYHDKPKARKGHQIETYMNCITCNLASDLSSSSRDLTLFTQLKEPHGLYFSGYSGCPIFALTPEGLVVVGIVQEAHPSRERHAELGGFLSQSDIMIRGKLLTPERFLSWLRCTPLSAQ